MEKKRGMNQVVEEKMKGLNGGMHAGSCAFECMEEAAGENSRDKEVKEEGAGRVERAGEGVESIF